MDNPAVVSAPQGMSSWAVRAVQAALVVAFVAAWEICVRTGVIEGYYFSSPTAIATNAIAWSVRGRVFHHLAVTLAEAGVGFVLGTFLGMVLGFLFAANVHVDAVMQPFVAVLNAMPRIAFAPLIILWLGLGFASKVFIVISLVFFVAFFNAYRGFKGVNPLILKNARVLGATPLQTLRHIYLPATVSWTFAGLRVGVGLAIIAAVLGEYIGAGVGIGYLIDNAQSNFDATGVLTGLTILTVTVAMLDAVVRRAEACFTRWQS